MKTKQTQFVVTIEHTGVVNTHDVYNVLLGGLASGVSKVKVNYAPKLPPGWKKDRSKKLRPCGAFSVMWGDCKLPAGHEDAHKNAAGVRWAVIHGEKK